MKAIDAISKLQLAVLRRIPLNFDRMYVPGFGQVVEKPSRLSSVFQEIFVREIYRPLAPLPDHPTIVDLGAHLGTFTLWAARRTRNATFHCVEANKPTFDLLTQNLERARAVGRNRFFPHNVAVSGESGWLEFTADQSNAENLGNSAFNDLSRLPDSANFGKVRVPARRLDDLVDGRIDFLKCDVEGAEYGVLEPSLLQPDRVGQLAAEFHEAGRNRKAFDSIVDHLLDAGYSIFDETSTLLATRGDIDAYRQKSGNTFIVKACARELLGNASVKA